MSREPRREFWDEYDHDDPSLGYVVESVLQEDPNAPDDEFKELKLEFTSRLEYPWTCISDCRDPTNDCFKYCNNYSIDPRTQELVINESSAHKELIYECNSDCLCSPAVCLNRLIQFGPRKDLLVREYPNKGQGLTSTKFIPKGAFICEYAGEILTRFEAEKRTLYQDDSDAMNYLMCFNERRSDDETPQIQTFIDPTVKGNIGRYLNHSCEPNCKTVSVRIDCRIPRVAIFAKRNIEGGEELCFHYGESKKMDEQNVTVHDETRTCFCGAKNCRGVLPNLDFS